MKSLSRYIAEQLRLTADIIDEHARERVKLIDNASSYDSKIAEHLGKIALNPTDHNTLKHIKDVSIWIASINDDLCKSKKPKMSMLIMQRYMSNSGKCTPNLYSTLNVKLEEYIVSDSKLLTINFNHSIEKFVKQLDTISYSSITTLQSLIKECFIIDLS